ncbi:FAD-binding protein [Haloferacaceae archaeon DSL9]
MGDSDRHRESAPSVSVVSATDVDWDDETDVLIAGGGGTGLVAALAACEATDLDVRVYEKAPEAGGNAALSTGMIPAAGTRLQRESGIEETPADFVADVMAKNGGDADRGMVEHLCAENANLIHWLVDDWDVTLHLVDDFKYPKHSEYRMHAPTGRNGENLIAELVERIEATPNASLATDSPVVGLVADEEAVSGALVGEATDGTIGGAEPKAVRARKVILATDGFAGNAEMVREHCDDMADALYYGSPGNTGDGVRLGTELGGELACMDAYQGHATVAAETETLSTYAVIMNGGIMVNERGERFGDESAGYSEFAVDVVRQPGGVAYEIFDETIFESLRGEFEDFETAIELGSYVHADDLDGIADAFDLPADTLRATVERYTEMVDAGAPDEQGRTDGVAVLEPPFVAAKVTGALFHTQGGLVVDFDGRVLRSDGSPVENLYAGGGVAVGISGHGAGGYLSGNGLTAACGLGRLAGTHAREAIVGDADGGDADSIGEDAARSAESGVDA